MIGRGLYRPVDRDVRDGPDICPLYTRVANLRKVDEDAFDREVARIFGPPDYSEAPGLKGYFRDPYEGMPACDEKLERAAQKMQAVIDAKHAEAAQLRREKELVESKLRIEVGARAYDQEACRAYAKIAEDACKERNAVLANRPDFSIAPATSTTPPELATIA